MKKLVSILLVALMFTTVFCSCTNKSNESENTTKNNEVTQQETETLEKDFHSIMELSEVDYPTSNEDWEYTIYKDLMGFYEKFVVITKYIGKETSIIIPKELDGYPVLSIENLSTRTESIINSVETQEGLLCIGNSAFYGSDISNIKISNTVQYIEAGAFSFCQELNEIEIPNSVKCIDMDAINGCNNLEKVIIPVNVEEINGFVSYRSSNLVVFGESGSKAAQWCAENNVKFEVMK